MTLKTCTCNSHCAQLCLFSFATLYLHIYLFICQLLKCFSSYRSVTSPLHEHYKPLTSGEIVLKPVASIPCLSSGCQLSKMYWLAVRHIGMTLVLVQMCFRSRQFKHSRIFRSIVRALWMVCIAGARPKR